MFNCFNCIYYYFRKFNVWYKVCNCRLNRYLNKERKWLLYDFFFLNDDQNFHSPIGQVWTACLLFEKNPTRKIDAVMKNDNHVQQSRFSAHHSSRWTWIEANICLMWYACPHRVLSNIRLFLFAKDKWSIASSCVGCFAIEIVWFLTCDVNLKFFLFFF